MCVDDHRIVREGIALIIGREPRHESGGAGGVRRRVGGVVPAASAGHHADGPAVGGISGVEAIRAIRRESADSPSIVLTMYEGDEDIYRAMQAGAATYLLKDALADDLVRTVREVYAGEHPMRDDVKAKLDERASQPALTPREIEVLALISRGMRNKVIAAELGITETTVAVHIKNLFAKLRVNERTAAVNVGVRRGIVHME